MLILRIWGSVQQLKGYPYPWGLDGDMIDYESENTDTLFNE